MANMALARLGLGIVVASAAACGGGSSGSPSVEADLGGDGADVVSADTGAVPPDVPLAEEVSPADEDVQVDVVQPPEDAEHAHEPSESGTHIHAVAFWGAGEEVAVGTHTGVFRTDAGSDALVALSDHGDYMGFVQDPFHPTTYWGSGHWAAGGFPNWGFTESTDGGLTWAEVSLSGTVDFHLMVASPDQEGLVAGTFGGKVYVSVDSGRNWSTSAWPSASTGIEVLSPSGPTLLLASKDGIKKVSLPGMEAETVVTGAVSGLGRHGAGFAYGTPDGVLNLCNGALEACTAHAGGWTDAVIHVIGAGERVVALTSGSEVWHSDDAGMTWALIVKGH